MNKLIIEINLDKWILINKKNKKFIIKPNKKSKENVVKTGGGINIIHTTGKTGQIKLFIHEGIQ